MSNKLTDRIRKGDRVKLNTERATPYARMYGAGIQDKVFTVTAVEKVSGRPRLYVDGEPTCIWANDAVLTYKPNSKERLEALGL